MTMNPNNETGGDDEFANGNLCPICLQSLFVEPEQTEPSPLSSSSIVGACIPCGHCFHSSCFNHWISGCSDTNARKNPSCPLCKRNAAHFLDLKDVALSTKREIQNENEEIESVDTSQQVVNAQLSQYTIGAYVPCGHCLVHDKSRCRNKSWEEMFAISISQYEIYHLTGVPDEECPSCGTLINAVLRLYIEPSNGIIAKIDNRIENTLLDGPSTVSSLEPTKGPSHITVRDAGISAVNGVYFFDGQQYNANRYIRAGMWNNMFCLFLMSLWPYRSSDGESQQLAWFISIGLQNDLNNYTDIDFYYVEITESSHDVLPPREGWICRDDSYVDSCDGKIAGRSPTLFYDHSHTMFLKPSSGSDTWRKVVVDRVEI